MCGETETSSPHPHISDRPMNLLKKNWPSAIIFITFSVLVVSLAIHSYYQPLEYDEYQTRSMALDAEYDKLFRESTLLNEGMGDISTIEKLMDRYNSMTPEEAAARRKALKKWLGKAKTLEREASRLERKRPVSPIFTPHR